MTFFIQILNTYNCHNNLIFLHVKIQILKILIPKKFFKFFYFIDRKKLIFKISPFSDNFLAAAIRRQRIIFACKKYIFWYKNTPFTKLSSFIWGSREIIFLKMTWKLRIQDTKFWLQGVASITDPACVLLSKQLILLVGSQQLLCAQKHSPYILFPHNLPNLYCF